jgi:predicted O-methyltransferase YrrM
MSISPVPGGLMAAPRRWDFLASVMMEQGYKTFVEVGCKEGRTTGHILKTVPDSRVVAIDPWLKQEKGDDPTRETYEEWDFEKIEKEFWSNVGEAKERCTMLRTTSKDAATKADWDYGRRGDDACDLVFIDALHDYESVMEDISLWWPKVRKGGILAGHDFNHKWPGVERAVADHFNLMGVGVGFDSVWFVIKR